MSRAFSQRWIAWLMRHAMGPYERGMAPRKRELFRHLQGTVLEIGCGTGPNRVHLPADARWLGFDPNPHMRPTACATAESLPLPDASMDHVIATLVLCSVADPAQALREVRRVLKPGGQFHFLEHVASAPGTWAHGGQRLLHPVCRACADGCNPLRHTGDTIQGAGFVSVELRHFSFGLPHIIGTALR